MSIVPSLDPLLLLLLLAFAPGLAASEMDDYVELLQADLRSSRVARFYQIERRLDLVVDIQFAAEVPLIP